MEDVDGLLHGSERQQWPWNSSSLGPVLARGVYRDLWTRRMPIHYVR